MPKTAFQSSLFGATWRPNKKTRFGKSPEKTLGSIYTSSLTMRDFQCKNVCLEKETDSNSHLQTWVWPWLRLQEGMGMQAKESHVHRLNKNRCGNKTMEYMFHHYSDVSSVHLHLQLSYMYILCQSIPARLFQWKVCPLPQSCPEVGLSCRLRCDTTWSHKQNNQLQNLFFTLLKVSQTTGPRVENEVGQWGRVIWTRVLLSF